MNSEQPGRPGHRDVGVDIDLDLLADYVGGAIEGTSDLARAADLVNTDPVWRDAMDRLVSADATVRADLARLAEVAEPMPPDVAARLDEALTGLDPLGKVATADRDGPVNLDAARKKRRYRIAAVAAVAAGILALAAPAGHLLLGQSSQSSQAEQAKQGAKQDPAMLESAPEAAKPPPGDRHAGTASDQGRHGLSGLGRGYPVTASGTEYTRDTLTSVREQRDKATTGSVTQAPEALSRLVRLPALEDCLAAIRSGHPGTVTIVDYARFEGAPALIVGISQSEAGDRVVVAGPECGLPGADVRYSTTG